MFPVSDVIPSRTTPIATISLIAVNVLAFFYLLQLDESDRQTLINTFGARPADLSWPTALTSLFFHTGWLHLGVNVLYLWIFGDNVEGALGRGRFLLLYFVCGGAAVAAHTAIHPWSMTPLIGASGAVSGLMATYLVLYPRSRVLTAVFAIFYADLIEVPALMFAGIWFVLQLLSHVGSIVPNPVDGAFAFWANVTGFLAGAVWGLYARFGAGALRHYWTNQG